MTRYGVAFLEGDQVEMERQLAWGTGKAGTEDIFFSWDSDTKAYFGHLAEARAATRRAIDSAQRNGEKEIAAQWQLNGAIREAEFANNDRARQEITSAQSLASAHDLKVLAALALARSGASTEAKKIADELEKDNSLNTMIVAYWVSTIRASIEIDHNNAERAVQILQVSALYELASPSPPVEFGSWLYPAFVRGEAFLLLHRGVDAAAEFRKFVDHRTLVANSPLGVLAHLQLGRAYLMAGETAKAKAAYKDFLTLWKDADPDIPIYKAAKVEYAKLQ